MNWRGSFVVLALLLSGCDAPPPIEGSGWRQVGGLDGDMIPFVEVSPDRAKDGQIYHDAIDRLCGPGRCVQVGFFLKGDPIPPSGSRGDFFRAGGWAGYQPLAVYMGDEFTKWDCERAGERAAPQSALCGENAHEEYTAILELATRDGWVKACGLPPFGGRKLVEKYAAGMPSQRRAETLRAYQEMFTSSSKGPDNPADCKALRSKIEERGDKSKSVIEAAIQKESAT